MVGHGGSSAGSYLADPTSPIPSHCASIVVTSTLRVKQQVLYFQFHVVELGPAHDGNAAVCSFVEILPFPVDKLHYDFPLSIQVYMLLQHVITVIYIVSLQAWG